MKRLMAVTATAPLAPAATLVAQDDPHAFPRQGTTRLFENR